MVILGVETSCDETAISVVEAEGDLKSLSFKVLGSAVNSQIKLHAEYGGVVPNLAKREHTKNLPIILKEALREAGFLNPKSEISNPKQIQNSKSQIQNIDLIAVTVGPGLEPALWTGINFAKELGKSWGKAVIPTNHMEGHIASVLLTQNYESRIMNYGPKVKFPVIASVVCSILVLMSSCLLLFN